jgi:hypothetical protein
MIAREFRSIFMIEQLSRIIMQFRVLEWPALSIMDNSSIGFGVSKLPEG